MICVEHEIPKTHLEEGTKYEILKKVKKANNQKGFQDQKKKGHQHTCLNTIDSILVLYHETSFQNVFPHSKDNNRISSVQYRELIKVLTTNFSLLGQSLG